MNVAGIMSGTSADGVDVAIVRITSAGHGLPRLKLLAHHTRKFPKGVRDAVLAAMNAQNTSAAELARLNWRLGLFYAETLEEAKKESNLRVELVGCHGQTIYHQPDAMPYQGARFACTWQLGEPAVIAASAHVPVVSDFRPADMAVGGQGAPLVPLLDYVFFHHLSRGRVLQNIGGIANFTVIPPGAAMEDVAACDSGPGNMVLDALMQEAFGKPFDRNGTVAAGGKVVESALSWAIKHKYFQQEPPKTAGREQFGREFSMEFLRRCIEAGGSSADAVTTATELTALTIAECYRNFFSGKMQQTPVDYILSGGGARNQYLVKRLSHWLRGLRCKLSRSDDHEMPAEAKEAVAFALLAWQTWNVRPGNLPGATGARVPAILGRVTYA
jgi:anhydro-N-acetylmuramic acid kinase